MEARNAWEAQDLQSVRTIWIVKTQWHISPRTSFHRGRCYDTSVPLIFLFILNASLQLKFHSNCIQKEICSGLPLMSHLCLNALCIYFFISSCLFICASVAEVHLLGIFYWLKGLSYCPVQTSWLCLCWAVCSSCSVCSAVSPLHTCLCSTTLPWLHNLFVLMPSALPHTLWLTGVYCISREVMMMHEEKKCTCCLKK